MKPMTNPHEQEGFDLDMLTAGEKEDIGMHPEDIRYLGKGVEKFQPEPPKPERCCFCNKKMKNPVTKFERYGFNVIPDGEKAHDGCARSRYETVKEFLKKEFKEQDNE